MGLLGLGTAAGIVGGGVVSDMALLDFQAQLSQHDPVTFLSRPVAGV